MFQQELLRAAFTEMHTQVNSWLSELDRIPAFYFESITQLQLASWSRGRIMLTGHASYCPGPAGGWQHQSFGTRPPYVLA
ncbi:hypothetical protein [Mycobacterium lepromatosis]|uniref:hypothetical protein n=1 Tax=Mycobacterium lepromatosis TaxID=480418 RepID=UPI000678C981|nr:hypothetical protein [Mycobacterium lepromatosis]